MHGENMNRGFLTIAQNGSHDYLKMAYVLAMSLKVSQSKYDKLSVIVNEGQEIPEKYLKVFDQIIYTDKVEADWKIDNKWNYYWLSPYDETIVLDCDMLLFNDIELWWESFVYDIEFTTDVVNFKGDVATSDYYRKTFTKNKLPNLYTGLFFFRKTEDVESFFRFVKVVFENWETFYKKFLKEPPTFLSGDVAYALAAKLYFQRNWKSVLKFTHMKSRLQDDELFDKWDERLPAFFTQIQGNVGLKVSNFNQTYPFHYVNKNFIKSEMVELYENTLRLL